MKDMTLGKKDEKLLLGFLMGWKKDFGVFRFWGCLGAERESGRMKFLAKKVWEW